MVEPYGRDDGITAFVVIRLWWETEGTPPLRARVRSVPDERSDDLHTVTVAGRGAVLEVVGRLLDEFEHEARRRTQGD